VRSAKRPVRLWLVVSLVPPQATTGPAPLDVSLPEARRMPLSRLLNDPFRALQEQADVTPEVEMADLLRPQAAAA
jgi:hypothetical protein